MDVASGLPPRFDVLDAASVTDPYLTYAKLRQESALCRSGPATWAVTRYTEVAALLRDPRLGHQAEDQQTDMVSRLPNSVQPNTELPSLASGLDPPAHTRIRRLMAKALNAAVLHRLNEAIVPVADRLVTRAVEQGRLDVVADLAMPMQLAIACDLLGVPPEDRHEVARQGMDLGRAIIVIPFVTAERGNGTAEAKWLRDYMASLVAKRRRARRHDLISHLIDARDGDGRLTDDEIIDSAVFFLFAGFETSIHLVAGGCATLLRFPGQLARLRADRSLVPTAVEEILRFDAPLQWISRMLLAPVEIAGRTLRPGRVLLLLLASANRDERQFTDADGLDVGRHPNHHLSFGGGIHHCLGVAMARAQGAVFLDLMLTRWAVVEPAGDPVMRTNPNVRGYVTVPITVKAT
jgi:cytochrome P450